MWQVYRLAVLLQHYSPRLALCDIPPFDLISCSLFENLPPPSLRLWQFALSVSNLFLLVF